MKKWKVILGIGLLVVSFSFLLFIFNQEQPTPADTITAYHKAVKAGEVEESKKYVSTDILKAFENGGFWQYGSYGNFVIEYKNKTKSVKMLDNTEKISGQTATIQAVVTYMDGRKETKKYFLVKENRKWKIAE